jgi:hypothetical protein
MIHAAFYPISLFLPAHQVALRIRLHKRIESASEYLEEVEELEKTLPSSLQ